MKNALILLFACLGMSCLAVVQYAQYGLNIEQANDYVSAGIDAKVGWTITAKQDITLQMTSDRAMLAAVNGHMKNVLANLDNGSFAPNNTALGYMTYDSATGAVGALNTLSFANNVDSIQMKAGDTIAFWLTTADGTFSSVRNTAGYAYNTATFGGGDNGNGQKVYNWANGWYKVDNSSIGYERSLLFGVGEPRSGTSGQPLPGVLATMLIGGSIVGMIRRKRKAC